MTGDRALTRLAAFFALFVLILSCSAVRLAEKPSVIFLFKYPTVLPGIRKYPKTKSLEVFQGLVKAHFDPVAAL